MSIRISLRTIFFGIGVCALLTACSSRESIATAQQELAKAAAATHELSAFHFSTLSQLAVNAVALSAAGSVSLDGDVRERGRISLSAADVSLELSPSSGPSFRVLGKGKVYLEPAFSALYLNALTFDRSPSSADEAFALPLNTWVRSPANVASGALLLRPGPVLLGAFLSSMTVTENHGKMALGEEQVRYFSVSVDPQKLQSALSGDADSALLQKAFSQFSGEGEVFVGIQNSLVRRLTLTFSGLSLGDTVASGSVDMTFSDFGATTPILRPDLPPLTQTPYTDHVVLSGALPLHFFLS